jgi:hypothetical protein
MAPIDMRAVVRAHAFLRTECPPEPWQPLADDGSFFRLLGEMIVAGLMRNGGALGELTLNVSNVTVEPDPESPVPAGDFVALTIRGAGDWRPELHWSPAGDALLVSPDLDAAARAAGVAYGYTRSLRYGDGAGAVTVFLRRAPPASAPSTPP